MCLQEKCIEDFVFYNSKADLMFMNWSNLMVPADWDGLFRCHLSGYTSL